MSFIGWLFYGQIMTACCECLKRGCSRKPCFKNRLNKYEKFQIALDRLSKEHDIQRMIALNRITKIVHKVNFLTRQRIAINFAKRYVISDQDIKQEEKLLNHDILEGKSAEEIAEYVLQDFDPDNQVVDRRIFYEITGMRIFADEFSDEDSDSSDEVSQTISRA